MKRRFNRLLFLLQMGLGGIKHLAETETKIIQSLEVPPYFPNLQMVDFFSQMGFQLYLYV